MSDAPDTTAESTDMDDFAAALAEKVGAESYTVDFETVQIKVKPEAWVATITKAMEQLELFSWLSAIDWSKTAEVGEGVDDPDSLEERFDVLCRLSSVKNADGAIFVTSLPRENPSIASLTAHIGGAEWHEREAHEMFGIDFEGNANLKPLYLPDDFLGNPLLKSYPLISREVKPWPGEVDVEPMPDVEADAAEGAEGGDE